MRCKALREAATVPSAWGCGWQSRMTSAGLASSFISRMRKSSVRLVMESSFLRDPATNKKAARLAGGFFEESG
jgi:hypothetical protein